VATKDKTDKQSVADLSAKLEKVRADLRHTENLLEASLRELEIARHQAETASAPRVVAGRLARLGGERLALTDRRAVRARENRLAASTRPIPF
jgi:hypothetical protein